MRWSLEIARIAGIRVRLHITFLLLLFWLFLNYYEQGGARFASVGLLFVGALFTCVILHEFGHALAAQAFGIRTYDITLLPIGGVARLERIPDKPFQELIVALAGPAVNVMIALGIFLVTETRMSLSPTLPLRTDFLTSILAINVWLILFNMLPAFPMDGGRVLRALLGFGMSNLRATQIAATIGKICAVLFALRGFFFGYPMLVFIAVFIFIGASQEVELARMREFAREVPASVVPPPPQQ